MAWTWRYQVADEKPVQVVSPVADEKLLNEMSPVFPNQGEAESWIGENWRGLASKGVAEVTLVVDDRDEYTMSLNPES